MSSSSDDIVAHAAPKPSPVDVPTTCFGDWLRRVAMIIGPGSSRKVLAQATGPLAESNPS